MTFGQKIAGVCACLSVAAVIGGLHSAVASGPMGRPPATLQSADRQHLLHDRFAEYRTATRIPAAVKAEMAKAGPMSVSDGPAYDRGEHIFRMADPGQPFQVGDAIVDAKLPWSRLIFVAVSPGYCVIEYETGGIAHFETAALYRLTSRSAQLVWKHNVRRADTDLESLRAAIARGEM